MVFCLQKGLPWDAWRGAPVGVTGIVQNETREPQEHSDGREAPHEEEGHVARRAQASRGRSGQRWLPVLTAAPFSGDKGKSWVRTQA